MTYALHAYRYGATNGHQYPLGVAPDLDTAKALAEHHTQYRGGKYGVAVYGAADGEEIPALVHYSPSMFKEDHPSQSLEISYQEILGGRILSIARGWSKMTADDILAEAKLYIERIDTP